MGITDELRKWGFGFCGSSYEVVNDIADRIDAEHKKQVTDAFTKGAINGIDMAEHSIEYVKLPVDVNGVPIRVGDVVSSIAINRIRDSPFEVRSIELDEAGWILRDRLGTCYRPIECRHHHPPTVEDVVADIVDRASEIGHAHIMGDMSGGEMMDALKALVTEGAAKLRLAGEDE